MSSLSEPGGSLDSLGWDPNKQISLVVMVTFGVVLWWTGNILLALLAVVIVFLPLPFLIVRFPRIQRKLLFHSWSLQAEKPLDQPQLFGLRGAVNRRIGELGCWYVKKDGSEEVVVYCHGSSGSRGNSYRVELVNFLSDLGCSVYSFDYRGYADSIGLSSQVNMIADTKEVVRVARAEHPASSVALYGHSMGTGVVCQTAYQLLQEGCPVDRIILEAPFLSIPDVILKGPTVRFINSLPLYKDFVWKFSDLFVTKDVIPHLHSVLILFAEDDEVIPCSHAEELHRLCPSSTLHLTKQGAHNFLVQQSSVRTAIKEHLTTPAKD